MIHFALIAAHHTAKASSETFFHVTLNVPSACASIVSVICGAVAATFGCKRGAATALAVNVCVLGAE